RISVHPVLSPQSSDVLVVLCVPRDQQGIIRKSDARDEHICPAIFLRFYCFLSFPKCWIASSLKPTTKKAESNSSALRKRSAAFLSSSSLAAVSRLAALPRKISLRV